MSRRHSFASRARAASIDERGAIAVMTAILMIPICGFAGLAIDGGRLLNERRHAQIAADHAALAAAWASCHGEDPVATGQTYAAKNGYPSGVVISSDESEWEAAISSSIETTFAGAIGIEDMDVTAEALATCVPEEAAAYALFASSSSCNPTLDWSGSSNNVIGGVHSNHVIKIGGSGNSVDGSTTYVTDLDLDGSGNTFDPVQASTTTQPSPVTFNIADYRPGGAKAVQAGTRYFNLGSGSKKILASDPPGLYYTSSGKLEVDSGVTKTVTLVSGTGEIVIDGSNVRLTPWDPGGLLAFTNRGPTCDPVLKTSGSNNIWTGILYAPRGGVELGGSSTSVLLGSVIANAIKLNGSGLTVDASGMAVPLPPRVQMLD